MNKEPELPTLKEMNTNVETWWKQRAEQVNSIGGLHGRDLLDQRDLVATVQGIEQDVSFILKGLKTIISYMEYKEEATKQSLRGEK